jgi:hypothetical protein
MKAKKIANPFLLKVSQMKRFKDTLRLEDHLEHSEGLRDWFVKNTPDLIKKEFDRYIKDENFEDNMWDLACDKIRNYSEYFPDDNSCNLDGKLLGEAIVEKR